MTKKPISFTAEALLPPGFTRVTRKTAIAASGYTGQRDEWVDEKLQFVQVNDNSDVVQVGRHFVLLDDLIAVVNDFSEHRFD